MAGRYGIQVRTVEKCKICQSPHRADIEDAYARGQQGEVGDDGKRMTYVWLMENSQRLWGVQLNNANIQVHCKKHFEAGDPEVLERMVRDPATALREHIDEHGVEATDPDDFLENVIAIANRKVLLNPDSITVEHGMKAVAEYTKRKTNEREAQLLARVAGAITDSVGRKVIAAATHDAEATAVEVPDGQQEG